MRDRMRYRFDNFMARGGRSFFIMLMVLFLGGIVLVAAIRIPLFLATADGTPPADSVVKNLWTIFLEMTDPGNMGEDSDSGALMKVVGVTAGMLGLTIFSMLIAFITTELGIVLEELKKGRSQVIETGHTLVLGWSDRVTEILRELITANESEPYACVTILAEREKEEMDDELKEAFPDSKTTRLIARTGSGSSLADLRRVHAEDAKVAIVLANCADSAT